MLKSRGNLTEPRDGTANGSAESDQEPAFSRLDRAAVEFDNRHILRAGPFSKDREQSRFSNAGNPVKKDQTRSIVQEFRERSQFCCPADKVLPRALGEQVFHQADHRWLSSPLVFWSGLTY